MENFLINLAIGILLIIGFFTYWGKAAGWYEEGGLMNELWKKIKNKKQKDDEN